MHDRFGNELKKDDVVLVPMRITALQPGEDYCNVTLQSIYGRRPDDQKETVYAINTGVTIRADFGG